MRYLLASFGVLLASIPAVAQTPCRLPGVAVSVSPSIAAPGQVVSVTLTNNSNQVIQLPSSCVFEAVHAGSACSTVPVLSPICLFVIVPLAPGHSYTGAWDQTDDNGAQVPSGSYSFFVRYWDAAFTSLVSCCPELTIANAFATASAQPRNGAGSNPLTLASVNPPRVGASWDTSLDCAAHAPGQSLLVVFDAPATGPLTSFGQVLVGGSRLARCRTEHNRQQAPLAVGELALRAGHQAVACGLGVAGLHAVDRWVTAEQHVAVVLLDVVERVVADRVIGVVVSVVADDVGGDRCHVARAAVVPRFGEPGDVLELRVLQAPGLRLPVHHGDEAVDAAGHALGQGHGGVIARDGDHALEQLVDLGRHLRVDEHQRTTTLALAPGTHRYRQHLLQRELLVLERAEDQVGSHQLGQRCRVDLSVGLALGEHLFCVQVDQHVVACREFGGPRRLGVSQRSQRGAQRRHPLLDHRQSSMCLGAVGGLDQRAQAWVTSDRKRGNWP